MNDKICELQASNESNLALYVVTYSSIYGVEENGSENETLMSPSLNEVYIIRTEADDPFDNDFAILESLLDIKTAMIMYNLGVANMFIASNFGSGEESRCAVKTLMSRTEQLFKLSHSLLRDMVEGNVFIPISDDNFDSSCCIYIGMYKGAIITEVIVLRSLLLIQMFLDIDCHTQLLRLQELLQTIEFMEKSSYIFDPILLNAPAA